MPHSLDEQGIIPKQMPEEPRELASLFALVIDTSTKIKPTKLTSTEIRCFEKGCPGTIKVEFLHTRNEIHWMCSQCQNEKK